MNDDQIAALDRYQPAWYEDAMQGHAEAASAVDDLCGPSDGPGDDLRNMEWLTGAILAFAVICTLVLIHFAARYFQ